MVKTGLAEWMMVQRFGAERANEIVGDLLEQYQPARAKWEMLHMALAIRGVELAGLLLVSLSITMLGTALYSPWQLHFMGNLRSVHEGWEWQSFSSQTAFASFWCLVTACCALRLGMWHAITRASFLLTVASLGSSLFVFEPKLWWISGVLFVSLLVWSFRSCGGAATLSSLVAMGVVVVSHRLLASSVALWEVRNCIVAMQMQGLRLPWFMYYSACTPLAAHEWFIWFVIALLVSWLVTFLPARSGIVGAGTTQGSLA